MRKESKLNEVIDGKYGKAKIIKYTNYNDIDVLFENGYIAKNKSYRDFKKYSFFNPLYPSIFNRGFVGDGIYIPKIGNKHSKEYSLWRSMFVRCYDKKYIENHPTYKNCEVCKEWYNFQTFSKWFNENLYYIDNEIIDLDKDLLCKGNKIYSPDTCLLVPQCINKAIIKGNLSLSNNNKYHARLSKYGKDVHLGYYDSFESAYEVYKFAKENYLKELACKYKDKIPAKVYETLINYKLN